MREGGRKDISEYERCSSGMIKDMNLVTNVRQQSNVIITQFGLPLQLTYDDH